VRSAFAAKTMQELGYRRRVDGRRLRPLEGRGPRLEEAGVAHRRADEPLQAPPAAARGRRRGAAKLLDAKVLLLGAGGLGSPAALYLAAAGVGTIGIVDMDEVDASNLQRQILHNIDRIGDRKVDSAKKTLTMLNPDVDVVTYDTRLSAENIMDILPGYDVVVDGADNFPSRYLLNDASVKLGIPVVHGSIFRFEGMVTVFHPKQGPTYRDMVPEPPPAELAPSCAEAGVLGVLPGIIGSIQALEAIKVILGLGDPLIGRILSVDTTEMEFRVFNLKPDPANEVTWANRDRIIVRELEGLCAPPETSSCGCSKVDRPIPVCTSCCGRSPPTPPMISTRCERRGRRHQPADRARVRSPSARHAPAGPAHRVGDHDRRAPRRSPRGRRPR
jgi:sulfur-carrier protein adenylyltransferase/sulfurtransferase